MTGSTITVRAAEATDRALVVDVLAEALATTALAGYLVADPAERRRVYHAYFELMVPWFLHFGHVYVASGGTGRGDGAGVAMWAACPGRFEPFIRDYDARLARATGAACPRFAELDAAMHERHPDRPHQYLAFLGVAVTAHGHGLGTALLAHQHGLLDAAGTSAYLEATGPRNAELYRRHGYTPGEAYRAGGPGAPPLIPMWRPGRAA